jgi:hypothetical protein
MDGTTLWLSLQLSGSAVSLGERLGWAQGANAAVSCDEGMVIEDVKGRLKESQSVPCFQRTSVDF